MVQVPTDSNMADINTKPLGGQRIRFLTNLIGCWHSEEQARVGELERKVRGEKKNFVGKINKIAKMIVRIASWKWKTPVEARKSQSS